MSVINYSTLTNEELKQKYYEILEKINNRIDHELDLKSKLEIEIQINKKLKQDLSIILNELKIRNNNINKI